MNEPNKRLRRRLRELGAVAYERELNRELGALFKHFEAWKKEEISPFDLSERIHEFHQKPARDLFVWYTDGSGNFPVAKAIADGILSEEEAGEEIVSLLQDLIAMRRDQDNAP